MLYEKMGMIIVILLRSRHVLLDVINIYYILLFILSP